MSSVVDAYNAITAAITPVVTSKTKIPNPYVLDDNLLSLLRDGYGITYGPARAASNREYHATWTLQDFSIHLTREILKLENDPVPTETAINALHNDIVELVRLIKDPTIFPCGISYSDTSAPLVFDTDDKQIMAITVTVVARTKDLL